MSGVLLCGGGSGGHLYAALALIEALKAHPRVSRIGFVGPDRALEACLFGGRSDVTFFPMRLGHFRGPPAQCARSLGQLARGAWEARRLLRAFRPAVVLGTGGYSSFPVMAMARLMGWPTAILELNAVMGLANRALAPHVDHVFFHWPSALAGIRVRRAHPVGVPVREALWRAARSGPLYRRWELCPQRPTLLVLGGSLGSQALNEVALEIARRRPELQLILSVGQAQRLSRHARRLPNVKALPYIDAMDEALALADLALCRGGALTLAELSACGVPALVVPWEGATDAHQLRNAQAHQAAGAGRLVREGALTAATALEALEAMLVSERYRRMRRASLAVGARHRGAGARIVKEVEPYLDGEISFHRHWGRRHERLGQGVLAATPSASGIEHRAQPPHG